MYFLNIALFFFIFTKNNNMKTAMHKFIKVIDLRIEKTTNEDYLKILKVVRKDLDMFLEIESRQIKIIYEKGQENKPLDFD